MKTKLYIIWIEGIDYRTGDKIKSFTDQGFEYTTKLTEAMRVKQSDLTKVRGYLKRHGIADFCLNSSTLFTRTTYAPKGTTLNTKKYYIGE